MTQLAINYITGSGTIASSYLPNKTDHPLVSPLSYKI